MKRKWSGFPVFLLIYHVLFVLVTWHYSQHNKGDAYRYWHLDRAWNEYLHAGTDVIKFINYPWSNMFHLPFWAGFVAYSLIGFCAIYQLYIFSLKYIEPKNDGHRYLLMFVFLLPNLHVWTSIIGKEPIVFLAITWIIINQVKGRYTNLQYVLGWVLLILIRPHVAMFLLMAIAFALVLKDKGFGWKKLAITTASIGFSLGLYLMTMHLLDRNPFDVTIILERNDASLVAFKRAGSYVPMINYNVFERVFALNFRPLFTDSVSLYSLIISAENFLILILLSGAMLIYVLRLKSMSLDLFGKIALLFFVISSLFFIQRYSCLGIFVRTKMMYMPFILITAIQIISQAKKATQH